MNLNKPIHICQVKNGWKISYKQLKLQKVFLSKDIKVHWIFENNKSTKMRKFLVKFWKRKFDPMAELGSRG